MMLLTTLIGPQGSLQVERGPSLAEGTGVLKVASDRGCLCCHLCFLGCRLRLSLESRGFISNAFGVQTCGQEVREAGVGRG